MASVLTAKVQNVFLNHRKPSPKSQTKRGDNRRSSQQQGRVIPPEPVQEKPEGDFTHHEIGPALSAHNLARATKGSKKLEWDDRLKRDAEAYAQKLAQLGSLEPSGVEDEGENVFMSHGDATLEDAVKGWLSQEKKYTGQIVAGGNSDEWGHFCKYHAILCNADEADRLMLRAAQCIWNSTKRVGMGKAKAANGDTYIVARYFPPGNTEGGKPF